ncbi:MAG: hypothetical protein GWN55_16845, partial [Phycisphaerae bacterium]|nr:hypothetical protein [Phycisphaerae bacterium]NIR26009.1 hypothetical protein [Gammaproteobacteria bacterium]NIS54197.1 hypothetical protein [Phycisphaerae bacterium]NIV02958.1 hypothetical protein [Phycisphaerae bacterium]NIW50312.1 hypothetical protein [Gammaproteobacteria bacterium]
MDNVQILYNVFDDLVEVTDDGGGPEDCWLQIKNQEGGSGTDPVVYGNTFTDYNCAIHLYDGGNTDYAVSVKNNIFDTPKSGGYHINVESFSGNGDNVFVDYNVYYPDTSGSDNVWTWDGTNCTDYDDWKTDSGQDGNSPADVADPLLQAD